MSQTGLGLIQTGLVLFPSGPARPCVQPSLSSPVDEWEARNTQLLKYSRRVNPKSFNIFSCQSEGVWGGHGLQGTLLTDLLNVRCCTVLLVPGGVQLKLFSDVVLSFLV